LELPPGEIDVNVHPTKKEVRYKNTNQVFNFIYSAIDMALSNLSFGKKSEYETHNLPNNYVAFPAKKEESDDVYVSEEALVQQTLLGYEETGNRSQKNEESELSHQTFSPVHPFTC